jgi:hypothetical protein
LNGFSILTLPSLIMLIRASLTFNSIEWIRAFYVLLDKSGSMAFNSIEWIRMWYELAEEIAEALLTFNSIEWILPTLKCLGWGSYRLVFQFHWMDSTFVSDTVGELKTVCSFQFHWMDSGGGELWYSSAIDVKSFNSIEWIRETCYRWH